MFKEFYIEQSKNVSAPILSAGKKYDYYGYSRVQKNDTDTNDSESSAEGGSEWVLVIFILKM